MNNLATYRARIIHALTTPRRLFQRKTKRAKLREYALELTELNKRLADTLTTYCDPDGVFKHLQKFGHDMGPLTKPARDCLRECDEFVRLKHAAIR